MSDIDKDRIIQLEKALQSAIAKGTRFEERSNDFMDKFSKANSSRIRFEETSIFLQDQLDQLKKTMSDRKLMESQLRLYYERKYRQRVRALNRRARILPERGRGGFSGLNDPFLEAICLPRFAIDPQPASR